tara:strand:+ start:3879 stop:4676 length:798 start_codon:yes stop_codon:yes gene_type:complete
MSEKYTIIKPEDNCGMCGYIWQTLRAMYHNPDKKYYVDFSNSIYKINDENIWDYFFEQPHTDKYPSESEIENVVGIIFDQESEFLSNEIKPNTEEEIQRRRLMFNEVIDKYFRLKPEVQEKIDSFVDQNFMGNKVLGVHFRGTDHPDKKHMDDYMSFIRKKVLDYDKLFICSDEWDRFRLAEISNKNKAISYDSIRSKGGVPLHGHPVYSPHKRVEDFDYQYKIAEDVIVESYLMSKVDYLVCCSGSNVNYFSRVINPNLEAIEL